MSYEFKAGDEVYLKSEGHKGSAMTVKDIGKHTGFVVTEWTDDEGRLQVALWPPQSITHNRPGLLFSAQLQESSLAESPS